ncbi:MAG: NfeD family protein [Pseudoclavibacter sp.]
MTLFIILGGVGLLLLLVTLIFGDFLDFDGGGLISVPGIAVGLVLFGGSGAITESAGLDTIWVYVIAIAMGLIAYALSAMVVRSLQRSSDGEARDVTGDTGVTMSRITVSTGEVYLDAPGEIERRQAFADEEIPQGVRIRVVRAYGPRLKIERETPAPTSQKAPESPTGPTAQ